MTWEAYAIRYGRHERTAQTNHLLPLSDPHEAMPLDYFVWLLRGPGGREIVVDTGFDHELAAKRGRKLSRSVAECLTAMGTDPAKVQDVIITHLHYDHAGSLGIFPKSEIVSVKGIALAGVLPPSLQLTITYGAGVTASSKAAAQAAEFIRFLIEPESRKIWNACGFDPPGGTADWVRLMLSRLPSRPTSALAAIASTNSTISMAYMRGMSKVLYALMIRKPTPLFDNLVSASSVPISATPKPSRMPLMIGWRMAGR